MWKHKNRETFFSPELKTRERNPFSLHLGIRSYSHKQPPIQSHAKYLLRGNPAGRRLGCLPSGGARKRNAGAAISLEGSEKKVRAPPPRAAGDVAPDGAAAPRAGGWVTKGTGRGVTGSFSSCPSPEMRAGASLWSRILRLLESSRVGAELGPEPNGNRRASGRKPRAVLAGAALWCARLFKAGARGWGR